jgi:hypothetical protein
MGCNTMAQDRVKISTDGNGKIEINVPYVVSFTVTGSVDSAVRADLQVIPEAVSLDAVIGDLICTWNGRVYRMTPA